MTAVINLFGGPGSGKSTLAAEIYVQMKKMNLECELVREYVKDWAWEGRKIEGFDQFYILGKQIRKESLMYDKVDFIITDSPLWNSSFYEKHYEGTEHLTGSVKAFVSYAESKGVVYDNYMLVRNNSPYKKDGRYETEDQAKEIDKDMRHMLEDLNLSYEVLNMQDSDRVPFIIEKSLERKLSM
jgi:nicotinamide riboside kinase